MSVTLSAQMRNETNRDLRRFEAKSCADILANALLGLVGGLVGAFGISSNLSAVSVANRPAAALEGFKWRFLHLGEEVEVSVVNGSTVVNKVHSKRPDSTQPE